MIAEAAEPNPWAASLILTQFTPASLDRKIPMPPMSAAAKRAGYPPDVAGAPRAIAQACVTPLMAEKDAPLFVEWKRPLSVETHTSPVTVGCTTIFRGLVEEPKVPCAVKVAPVSLDR